MASKFALAGLTESLACHLAPWNIRVSIIEPEGVKTLAPGCAELGSRVLSDTDAYRKYCEHAQQQMKESYDSSMEAEVIAELIQEILDDPSPHLRYPVGEFAQMRARERFCDPTGDSYVEFKKELLAQVLASKLSPWT